VWPGAVYSALYAVWCISVLYLFGLQGCEFAVVEELTSASRVIHSPFGSSLWRSTARATLRHLVYKCTVLYRTLLGRAVSLPAVRGSRCTLPLPFDRVPRREHVLLVSPYFELQGCEFAVVEELASEFTRTAQPFGQILMEIHDTRNVTAMLRLMGSLEGLGYRLFHAEVNSYNYLCYEIALVHETLVKP